MALSIAPEAVLAMEKPWDQLPGEANVWFTRFQKYLALPTKPRSLKMIYNQEVGGKNYPSNNWNDAARMYFWRERTEMYDKSIAKEIVDQAYGARIDAGKEIAQSAEKVFKQYLDVVKKILDADLSTPENMAKMQSELKKVAIVAGTGKAIERAIESYKAVVGEKKSITSHNTEVTLEW